MTEKRSEYRRAHQKRGFAKLSAAFSDRREPTNETVDRSETELDQPNQSSMSREQLDLAHLDQPTSHIGARRLKRWLNRAIIIVILLIIVVLLILFKF
ncbi:MAG: hypothetical protein ACTIAG_00570 [Lactobacillus sp.]|nr:hypothetical protein [Lactobacillus sp.]MDN6052414.1 hypothetical protein [Lactobacillus sp.]